MRSHWLRRLWARFCRAVVRNADHPALLVGDNYQAPDSPWELVGFLNGESVRLRPDTGARARMAYDGLLHHHPAGWLEFRHRGVVRSRYVAPQVP